MLSLTLERIWLKPTYTIGRLLINKKFFCNTLEDRVIDWSKEKKVPGKTAIPAGKYKVIYNQSPRFRRKLPRLIDVPNFTGILIHPGNTEEDTSGCILVGYNTEVGKLTRSRECSNMLNEYIETAINNGETVTIEIT